MIIENKPVVIEISEEAYKQNTVYRPWPESKAAETIEAQIHAILNFDSRALVWQNHA